MLMVTLIAMILITDDDNDKKLPMPVVETT